MVFFPQVLTIPKKVQFGYATFLPRKKYSSQKQCKLAQTQENTTGVFDRSYVTDVSMFLP